MPDTLTKSARSAVMRCVKSTNTEPEVVLRKELWLLGVRGWRLHGSKIPGKPDIIFNRIKLAIFVDGCFWHGCPTCYRRPSSNQEYWDKKLERNISRDKYVNKQLENTGWIVVRFWEHEVKNNVKVCAGKIASKVQRLRSMG